MKTTKIIYWIATIIVSVMMAYSAYMYLNSDVVKQGFTHLGFPSYFRIELAIAKLIGAVILLVPIQAKIKEWMYAGFAIVFVSAFIAHISSGDPLSVYIMPLIFLIFLLVSYLLYSKAAFKSSNRKITTAALT